MARSLKTRDGVDVKRFYLLFFGSLLLIPISMAVGWFDNTTELLPRHERADVACLIVAGLCGVLAGGTGIYLTRKLKLSQRIVLPLVITLEAAVGVFLVTGHAASIVEGWADFPAGKTELRQVLIRIGLAYRTHGKSASQYIRTMPFGSDLEINGKDFTYMQSHRGPGDNGRDPDRIASGGFFCAKVMVERSDNALRILHAGSHKLPEGTVIVCPDAAGVQ